MKPDEILRFGFQRLDGDILEMAKEVDPGAESMCEICEYVLFQDGIPYYYTEGYLNSVSTDRFVIEFDGMMKQVNRRNHNEHD